VWSKNYYFCSTTKTTLYLYHTHKNNNLYYTVSRLKIIGEEDRDGLFSLPWMSIRTLDIVDFQYFYSLLISGERDLRRSDEVTQIPSLVG
jgi:hypothetical protein